jgi:hypothetical protein
MPQPPHLLFIKQKAGWASQTVCPLSRLKKFLDPLHEFDGENYILMTFSIWGDGKYQHNSSINIYREEVT